jgi:hypothetical protein
MTTKLYFVSADPNPRKYIHDHRATKGTGIFWDDRSEAEKHRDELNALYNKEVYKVFMWKGAPQQL